VGGAPQVLHPLRGPPEADARRGARLRAVRLSRHRRADPGSCGPRLLRGAAPARAEAAGRGRSLGGSQEAPLAAKEARFAAAALMHDGGDRLPRPRDVRSLSLEVRERGEGDHGNRPPHLRRRPGALGARRRALRGEPRRARQCGWSLAGRPGERRPIRRDPQGVRTRHLARGARGRSAPRIGTQSRAALVARTCLRRAGPHQSGRYLHACRGQCPGTVLFGTQCTRPMPVR